MHQNHTKLNCNLSILNDDEPYAREDKFQLNNL